MNLYSDYQQNHENIREEESFEGKNSSSSYQQLMSNKSSGQKHISDIVPNQELMQGEIDHLINEMCKPGQLRDYVDCFPRIIEYLEQNRNKIKTLGRQLFAAITNCPEFWQNSRKYLKFYFSKLSNDEVRNIMYLSSNRLSSSNSDQENVVQMIYITLTLFEVQNCIEQYKRDYPIDEYRLENWPAKVQQYKKHFTNTV